jgi:enoyl-CoA hydratase/carnithine racemase
MTSDESELLVERTGALMRLTINRPRAANAISEAVAAGLVQALAEANGDETVRAVILTGAGERAFSAGRDMKNPRGLPLDALNRQRRQESEAYTGALLGCEKPLVVALNGVAIGAGWMLAMHADQVVAAEHVVLSMPEVDIGIATFLGHALLTELVGGAVANELVLTGRKMPAQEALRHGLVSAVVPAGQLAEEALARAEALGAKPEQTFRQMKGWILARRRAAVEHAYREHAAATGMAQPSGGA